MVGDPPAWEICQRTWEPWNVLLVSPLGIKRPGEGKALTRSHVVSLGQRWSLNPELFGGYVVPDESHLKH